MMLTEMVAGPRVWEGKHFVDSGPPRLQLGPACQAELKALARSLVSQRSSPMEIRPESFSLSSCRALMDRARNVIENGRGFVLIENLLQASSPDDETTLLYWLLGRILGSPFKQNVKGDYLYHVRDTGQKLESGVRPSTTAAETTFHTDYSFGDPHPDYVGLLCLRPGKEGGLSQLVSAYTVHNKLLENNPSVLPILYGNFHFDKRGEFHQGEPETAARPVFDYDQGTLTLRYMREYIRCGHQKAATPLSEEQARALDALDSVTMNSTLQIEFSLRQGESLWINNRWIAHNRTPFKDDADPEKRRHYLRLWLTRFS